MVHPSAIPATAYVGDNGSGLVTMLDLSGGSQTGVLAGGSSALAVAVSPTKNEAYLVRSGGVDFLNRADNTITQSVTVSGAALWDAVVSPDGQRLYAADGRGGGNSRIVVIETSSPYNVTTIPTVASGGNISWALALSKDGTRLYVGDRASNKIITIDTSTDQILGAVTISGSIWDIELSPDDSQLLATGLGTMDVLPITNGMPGSPAIPGFGGMGCAGFSSVYSADGAWIYTMCGDGTVERIDPATGNIDATEPTGLSSVMFGALTPDGSRLYVTSPGDNAVVAVDLTPSDPTRLGTAGSIINTNTSAWRITIAGLPDAPLVVGPATAGNAQATLNFMLPTNTGNLPILEYRAIDAAHSVDFPCPNLTSPCVVTGLTNGTTYDLELRAVNSSGQSVGSSPESVTPMTVPDAPLVGTATASSGQVSIAFTAQGTGGDAITGYTATDVLNGGTTYTCTGSLPPCVVTGLQDGTLYAFTLHATNTVGNSLESGQSNSVTPTAPTVPDPPTIGTATPGDTEATVNFTAPLDDGGSAIDAYRAVDTGHLVDFPCPHTTSPCVVTGLANGTEYHFAIIAHNALGDSQPSGPVTVTPAKVPDAPLIGLATGASQQVSVAFTAPVDDGGAAITAYTAGDTGNGISFPCPHLTSPCVVTGLANGTTYTFTVHAENSAGPSPESGPANPVTPAEGPGAPLITGAHRGNAKITIDFTDGATGGAAITSHTATDPTHGSFPCVGSGGSCEVQNLTNGTAYTFTLHATNSAGNSLESNAASTLTPATVPAAPAISAALPGNAQVTLTFVDGSTGGDPITSHAVSWTMSGGSGATQCVTNPCLITGLANGTAYTFKAKATNGVGSSGDSAATLPVTPVTLAGAPVVTSLRVSGTAVVVAFSAPSGNGGSPIVGYQIRLDGGTWTPLAITGTDPYTATVGGLSRGVNHLIALRAVNGTGPGVASADSVVRLPDVPAPPTAVTAEAGNAQASVSFSAPANDGGAGITGYLAVAAPGGASGTCASSPCTVTGLRNGVRYTFTVRAANAVGYSAFSAPSGAVTPAGPPGAPGGLAGTPAATSIALLYSAAEDGGSPIIRYEVSIDGGTTWSTLTGDTVRGLTPGTAYTIAVRAVNANGTGPSSGAVGVTTLPPTMAAPVATAGVSSVTVTWTAAASTGVIGYTVRARPGPATCTTLSREETSCVIGGAAGTGYTFTVAANTRSGDSAASAPSNVVTPLSPPVPPAPPADASPTLQTPDGQPAQLAPGAELVLLGTGFAAHSTAKFTLYSKPIVLGTAVTDGAGRFTVRGIKLPAGLAPGKHTLVASGVDPDGKVHRVSMTFLVKAAATPADEPDESLPTTGAAATPLALLGFVLLVGGVWLVRRRVR
jgi:titin